MCACVNVQFGSKILREGLKTEDEPNGTNGMVPKELCVKSGLDLKKQLWEGLKIEEKQSGMSGRTTEEGHCPEMGW